MAFTQAQLDLLDEMIASGILESETADQKRVKFGSFAELRRRRAYVAKALRGTRRTTAGFVSFEDGNSE